MLLGRPAGLLLLVSAAVFIWFAFVSVRTEVDATAIALGVCGALLLALSLRAILRAARGAELLVYNDRLVIENPSVFKGSVTIPRGLISVVSVDATKGDRRFPVAQESSPAAPWDEPSSWEDVLDGGEQWVPLEVPAHLYTPATALLLPEVGEPNNVPDVLVLFEEPIFLRPLRLLPGYVVRGRYPSATHPERGFWTRVRDPERAAHVLSFVAPVRGLRTDDVLSLLPQIERAPAVRRRQVFVVALFVGLAIARLISQFWPEDPGSSSVAGPDYCSVGQSLVDDVYEMPAKRSAPPGKTLTRAIAEVAPPDGYVLTESDYGTLEQVAGARRGRASEWMVRLDALNFRSAYSQIWENGSSAVKVDVTEFEEYSAAVDYLSFELLYGCRYTEIFPVAGTRGAVGRESSDNADGRVLFTYVVRGGRTISVSHWNRSGDVDREMAAELTQQAAAIAEAPRTP